MQFAGEAWRFELKSPLPSRSVRQAGRGLRHGERDPVDAADQSGPGRRLSSLVGAVRRQRGSLEPDSIYKSDAARAAVEALYDLALAQLSFPTESRRVDTTFGSTHVLVAGPEGAAPILALQGGNVVNPLTLAWLTPLAGEFRIYAPDTIGQPGKSSGRRVSANDASLGEWCEQVLDGLG